MKKLSIELRVGESISVSGPATIRLQDKSGSRARLLVLSADEVSIDRPKPISPQARAKLGLVERKQ